MFQPIKRSIDTVLHNKGESLKLNGVIQEVKTQISYSSNLFGLSEEEHAGGPHSGRRPEPWQDALGDDGLNLKEQEGGDTESEYKESPLGVERAVVGKLFGSGGLWSLHTQRNV